MSTEIAIRSASLPEKMEYAKALAFSGMLPKQYQGNPANLLWAIEYGETIGIAPMAAVTGIHVIEGKPSASAALISGLVRRAGHKLRVSGDARSATAEIVRCDDPSYVFSFTFTIEDAQRAGLAGKAVWKQYPAAMLRARATTQVARDACEEILFGLHYTPEELGAEVDADGNVVDQRMQRATARPVDDDPWQTPGPVVKLAPGPDSNSMDDAEYVLAAAPTPAAEPEYAEVVGEQPATAPLPSDLIAGLRVVRGAESPEAQYRALSQLLGHEVAVGAELTRPDVERALSALRKEDEANAKQRQQDEREATRAAESAIADPQQVDWILTGLTKVRGITDPQSKRVAIEYMIGAEMPDPYQMTAEQAASVRATLEAEYEAGQQPDPGPARSTEKAKRAMHAAFKGAGIATHDERVAYAGAVVGHAITSTDRLTATEVGQVIDALNGGVTLASFSLGERARALESMVASATTSDELAGVSERFWQEFEAGEITDVERDVLISASGRRQMQLAQQQKAPVAA